MSSVNGAMDYRGIDVSGSGGGNPPTPLGGFMKYKGNWNTNLDYFVNDYVVYNRISYIAVADNAGNQPDIRPLLWNVVSYWSNPNNVSNFRGYFIPFIQMQQYDSVQDRNTGVTYVYLGINRYTTTTLQDLINTCPILQNAPQLQEQLQTPCYFAFSGNGTSSTGGLLFPQKAFNDPTGIIQQDLDFQTQSVVNGFRRQGTTIVVDGSTVTGKEGYYNVSCSILMWVYQNNFNFNQFYQGPGYFEIAKIDAGGNRTGIVRNQAGGPFQYYNAQYDYYYPASLRLECIVPLRFNEGVALNCTNVYTTNCGFAIAPTINIKYLGPFYDPIA
jgi:hypothetical protein